MAKQTFTTGQVLTAAQMTSLQQTAMGGGSATAKTANYVLVAADAGTTVIMNAAGSTTITVNTGLFAAGDTVLIQNIGAGTTTVTAGTATVNTAGSLALAQYEAGMLYFTATGAAVFHDYVQASGATSDTWTTVASSALSGLSTITVSSLTYNKLAIWAVDTVGSNTSADMRVRFNGSTTLADYDQGFLQQTTTAISFLNYPGLLSAFDVADVGGTGGLWLNLENGKSTSKKPIEFAGGGNANTGGHFNGFGNFNGGAAVTSVTVFLSSGTWSSGTLNVYGA